MIFQEHHMDIEDLLNLSLQDDLLIMGKPQSVKEDILELLPEDVNSPMSPAFHEDSSEKDKLMSYLDCLELPITSVSISGVIEDPRVVRFQIFKQTQLESGTSLPKEKKAKKVENSPFHNYQKHLNNALKKLVILPHISSEDEEFKLAARDIWRVYVSGEIKTKKILHFVFNQKNEHCINEGELRAYGLFETYQLYDISVISKAKNYLSRLAIDQIDELNIENYIKSRKMRRTDGFKDYVMNFKKQLESGYIKRRAHCE